MRRIPYARAWGQPGGHDWPQKTLAAIAAEDLSRVKKLTVLDLERQRGGGAGGGPARGADHLSGGQAGKCAGRHFRAAIAAL